MPVYKRDTINTINIAPTVISIYSYRTLKTELSKNICEKNKLYSSLSNKNYGDQYDFPVNYPSVNNMQASVGTIGTNLGTIPF